MLSAVLAAVGSKRGAVGEAAAVHTAEGAGSCCDAVGTARAGGSVVTGGSAGVGLMGTGTAGRLWFAE